MPSLAKADVETALEFATGNVKEILELRGDLAKSSVKKYQAMHNVTGTDGRARGLIQFYGAGRTGRFAGASSKFKTCPVTTCPTSTKPAPSPDNATSTPLNCSTTPCQTYSAS